MTANNTCPKGQEHFKLGELVYHLSCQTNLAGKATLPLKSACGSFLTACGAFLMQWKSFLIL
jgi:hypothetical protein